MFQLLALGDIHTYRLAVAPWRMLGKRLVGQLNLYLNRRHHFDRTVLALAARHIAEIKPDLLLMTGDLTSTALRAEFDDVAEQLSPIWSTTPSLVLPGNHDRYTIGSTLRHTFERALAGHGRQGGGILAPGFPHLRRLNARWQLLAIDAAVPRPLWSRGRLGGAQLAKIRTMLASLGQDEGLVVACHYPMVDPPDTSQPAAWGHLLGDRAALKTLLAPEVARRPVIYVHGHIHRSWCEVLPPGRLGGMVDVNAGALAMVGSEHRLGQGFWQLTLPDDLSQPLRAICHRCVSHDRGGWIATEKTIPLPWHGPPAVR